MKITYSYYGKLANIVSLSESGYLKNGYLCFYRSNLADFPYSFTALETGDFMFMSTGYHKMESESNPNEFNFKLTYEQYCANAGYTEALSDDDGDYITPNLFPILSSGYYMFAYSYNLKSIKSDFPKLENGTAMFYNAQALTDFDYIVDDNPKSTGDLKFYNQTSDTYYPKWATGGFEYLSCAYCMFMGSNITSFYRNLPSLKDGSYMFAYTASDFNIKPSDIDGHDTVDDDWNFNNLEIADYMFMGSAITKFNKELPSLKSGRYMFAYSEITDFYGGVGYEKYDLTNSSGYEVINFELYNEIVGSAWKKHTLRGELPDCSYMFLNSKLKYIHWYGAIAASGESYKTMFMGCEIASIPLHGFLADMYTRCSSGIDKPEVVIYLNMTDSELNYWKSASNAPAYIAQMYKGYLELMGVKFEGNISEIQSYQAYGAIASLSSE